MLVADEWEPGARQLGGADSSTWRGVLQSVCRAARNGVDGAVATVEGGRRLHPAVLTARLALLTWAEKQDCGSLDDGWMVRAVAEGGWLGELQWGVHARGWGLPRKTSRGGHLEVLQWARGQGCPWGPETCHWAARGGTFELLKWARAQGCPWGDTTCGMAACGGHLKLLQWARENSCTGTRLRHPHTLHLGPRSAASA
eukprot:jgi/Tetstr1/435673/TSEL_024573.t1